MGFTTEQEALVKYLTKLLDSEEDLLGGMEDYQRDLDEVRKAIDETEARLMESLYGDVIERLQDHANTVRKAEDMPIREE